MSPKWGFDVMQIEHASAKDLEYFSASPDNATQKYLFSREPSVGRVTPQSQPGWHDYQISTDGSLAIHTGPSSGSSGSRPWLPLTSDASSGITSIR